MTVINDWPFVRLLAGICLCLSLPTQAADLKDVPYGSDPAQHMDVYEPAEARAAPVILMVHGGGWRRGDKSARGVTRNKIDRWVPRGFIVASINYRMLPDADVLTQAADVARALAFAQSHAHEWGGDPDKVILMGHSAGAHLVSFLTANPAWAQQYGARSWLGTVSLDSAAFDVSQIMQSRHLRLYDQAFGDDPQYWASVSPIQVLASGAKPLLAVCSSIRRDQPCRQAHEFARRGGDIGMRVEVLEQPLSHGAINADLGESGPYTQAVESFMRSLDPGIAERLR